MCSSSLPPEAVLRAHDVAVHVRTRHREDLVLEVGAEVGDRVDEHARCADCEAGAAGGERAGRRSRRRRCRWSARTRRPNPGRPSCFAIAGRSEPIVASTVTSGRQTCRVDARELHELVVVGGGAQRAVVAELHHERRVLRCGDATGETSARVVHCFHVGGRRRVHGGLVELEVQMWPNERPLPIGGMPWCSRNVMNADSSRLMMANE
jgi:hypothetical protein